jgi:hypothetical protein
VAERNRFLMIQAEEIATTAGDGRTLHLNVSNLGKMLTGQFGATGREVRLHVNHPNHKWGVTAEDLAAVVGERFFEVWNGVDGDRRDVGYREHAADREVQGAAVVRVGDGRYA